LGDGAADFPVQRMSLVEQATEQPWPVGAQLLVEQGLGAGGFLHPDKAIVALAIGQSALIHLAGQPVAPVQAKVHGEGKPSLDADVAQAQFVVKEVVIKVETFAGFEHQMNVFGLAVAAHGVGQTVFQRAEDGDQAGGHAVLAGDLPGQRFFADLTAGQPAEGASGYFGAGVSGGFEARGQPVGESAEVFDEDAAGVEIGFHDGGLEEMPQRARKRRRSKPDKTPVIESPNRLRKAGGTPVTVGEVCEFITQTFTQTPRCSATLVAA